MNLGFVTNLTILANTGHGAERSLFEEIAKRWEAGQWGMYPIAVCLVFALAITIERAIVLFGKASINKDAFLRGLKKHIYAGQWGMSPIAVCLVFALAITIERAIVLFGKASINKDAFLRGLKKHIY